jgi:hypothetical protein
VLDPSRPPWVFRSKLDQTKRRWRRLRETA